MKRIISFDLFETLINRNVWPHYSVVWFLADKTKRTYGLDFFSNDFINRRLEAERSAYRSLKGQYTLDKIYDNFEFSELPAEIVNNLPALEAELEIELAVPIERNIQRFKAYQQAGHRVIIITDTYLERDTIERIIEKGGLSVDRNDIFISNELGQMKVKGKLFKEIGRKHKVNFIGGRHIGNSRGSDVHGSMYAGIIPSFFSDGNCNDFESTLTSSIAAPSLTMAATIGEIRNWRFAEANRSNELNLASSIFAFVAISYLSWIIRTCRENSIQRVYLLARDCYLLSEVTKLGAFSKHQGDIEFRYLYGSRTTIKLIDEEESVHQYLEQEGIFDDVKSAIVDVGWRGSFHAGLHEYITKGDLPPVYGLFIGLEPADSERLSHLRYSIFDQLDIPSKRLKNRFDANFIYLVEALFQAPHPSTVAYRNASGTFEPVFKDSSFDFTQVKEIQSASLQLAEKILERPSFQLDDRGLEVALKKVLVRIALQPSLMEAIAVGSINIESDTDERVPHYPLSTRYTFSELFNILLRRQGLSKHRRQWARGRIASSNLFFRTAIDYLDRKF